MIRWLSNYFQGVSPAFVDGALYVAIAFVGAIAAAMSSDEAAKFISATVLFWARTFFQSVAAALLALKMFRSTSFAEHVEQKKKNGDTAPPFKP
jgi:uncharacterized membrane protein